MVKVLENKLLDVDVLPNKEQQELQATLRKQIDEAGGINNIPPEQKEKVQGILGNLSATVTGLAGTVGGGVKGIADTAGNAVGGLTGTVGGVVGGVGDAVGGVGNTVSAAGGSLQSATGETAERTSATVESVGQSTQESVGGTAETGATDDAEDVYKGGLDELKSAKEGLEGQDDGLKQ